jgi:hypothetical protein
MLLSMKIRPFLSHKRENALVVGRLKWTLQLYGAGGWKDTDDLRMGASTEEEIRRVIADDTGGFLWWGTRAALSSWMMNNVEIPAAFARASSEDLYPLVPVFVDLAPGSKQDKKEITSALGDHAQTLLDRNGVVHKRSEPTASFRRSVASRYVRDAVRSLPEGPLLVAFRALSEPAGGHDLTFDWRHVFDARTRHLDNGALLELTESLSNARVAFQRRERNPTVNLDMDLPLPLAFLVGYEWRLTSRLRLRVEQRTGSSFAWVDGDGLTTEIPTPVVDSFDRPGPAVLAVSCGGSFDRVARRYADEQSASRLVTVHVPGLLDAGQMRSIVRKAADCLRDLNNDGLHKHLLIKGPVTIAVMLGAASNASGPVTVPFWDGSRYVSPITVGP